jgi:hypothetical protein
MLIGSVMALGLGVCPADGSAQVMNAAAAVSALTVGEQVRVQAPGASVELGIVSELDENTLYVTESGQEWLVDIDSIERLEVRRRSVVKYALIFGVVGAVAGAGAHKFRESVAPGWFLYGGVAGGALFGYTQWQWRVRYPR